jgi:signal-transduction protein with cAMP-binding, CBS, and nucleotidyltransferase domain
VEGFADRRLETTIRELMSPGAITVSEDASIRQAERAMVRHGVHAILILGRAGRPLGWVTARGLLTSHAMDRGLVPASNCVTEIPTYIDPSATAGDAIHALAETGVSHLLVSRVPGEPPQGVVSDLDLVALLSSERR